MNEDKRIMKIQCIFFILLFALCIVGIAVAQEPAEPIEDRAIVESIDNTSGCESEGGEVLPIETEATIDSTEAPEPTQTPEPDPTLEPEAQKQLDLQSGITTALSAPEVLSEAELQSASVYESDNDVIYLGSDHPYASNTLQIVKFTHSGAAKLTIYFGPNFELEKGYDTFGIYTFEESISGYRLFEGKSREIAERSEERRVGKECRSRWSPYH